MHEEDLKFPALSSSWNVERSISLEELDCIVSWGPHELSRLKVPEKAFAQARHVRLERGLKQRRRCTADEAAHLFQPQDRSLLTFMAQYGDQRPLQGELLLQEDHNAEPRFWRHWCPAEVARWVVMSQIIPMPLVTTAGCDSEHVGGEGPPTFLARSVDLLRSNRMLASTMKSRSFPGCTHGC